MLQKWPVRPRARAFFECWRLATGARMVMFSSRLVGCLIEILLRNLSIFSFFLEPSGLWARGNRFGFWNDPDAYRVHEFFVSSSYRSKSATTRCSWIYQTLRWFQNSLIIRLNSQLQSNRRWRCHHKRITILRLRQDISTVLFREYTHLCKAIRMARVNEGLHSFICHPHTYPRMEWAICLWSPAAAHHRTLAGTHLLSHRR